MAFQFNEIMEEEIWKDIPNYEGMYQVSNLGRVKSFVTKNVKILKQTKLKSNYYKVGLFKYGVLKNIQTHQLVAMAFLNHIPCGFGIVVDHIDNNGLNNKLENLQLISHRENISKSSNGFSKYVGVSKQKNKWVALIRISGVKKYLGSYNTEIEASNAYQDKLKEISITTHKAILPFV